MSSSPPQFRFNQALGSFNYDLARWPHKEYLDLTLDNITGTAFTLADTTQIVRANTQFDTTSRFLIEDFPTFMDSTTNLTLLNEGNNIDYNRDLVWYTPMDAIIDRMTFNIAFGFNVSNPSAGNFRINRVNVVFETFKSSGQRAQQESVVANFTTTNMTTTDNMIVIFNQAYTSPLQLYAGGALCININLDTVEGTGTWQKGIMSSFPYQNSGGQRTYSKSGIMCYMRPSTYPQSNVYKPAMQAAAAAGVY